MGAAALALLLAALFAAGSPGRAEDVVEPMPALTGLAEVERALGTRCGAGEPSAGEACTLLGDARLRAGDGAAANALYRRAADLSRAAETPSPPSSGRVRVTTVADAIAALEAAWDTTVVPAAARHGMDAFARDARPQVFGAAAVAAWAGRRASTVDAYRTVHTWRTREGAIWAPLAWIGDLASLAAPRDVWELRLGWMNLDFMAYVDEAGTVVAICHFPEG